MTKEDVTHLVPCFSPSIRAAQSQPQLNKFVVNKQERNVFVHSTAAGHDQETTINSV
jgi:hypothetical protein